MTFEQHYKRLAAISSLVCLLIFYPSTNLLAKDKSREQLLGWVNAPDTFCNGYYNQDKIESLPIIQQDSSIHVTGDETLFSQHDTTTVQGNVLVRREDESMRADKVMLYRSPSTHEISNAELVGNIHLNQPNTMILAKKATYNFKTKAKFLVDAMYRMLMQGHRPVGKHYVAAQTDVNTQSGIITAWGNAAHLDQTKDKQMDLTDATYSTCPPTDSPVWMLKARDITLDKETGRGSATHVSILASNIPVFYLPYINFPIDSRRKSGLLWPSVGTKNGAPYFSAPFYWNIAPNYDMLLTPTLFSNRGLMLADQFRYLHEKGHGDVNVTVLPDDRFFGTFQANNMTPSPNDSSTIQASKIRLGNASTARHAIVFRDDTRYNANWSSHINLNHTSDDYFLRDFGGTLNDASLNQLLQEAELNYQSPHWNFIGRMQAYQTLHPFNEAVTLNAYRRFPQLILNGRYPDTWGGLEYFLISELTNFDIRKTPGSDVGLPVGQREHLQPGVSLPLTGSFGFITPRIQIALTQYNLHQTTDSNTPTNINRAIPIIDIASGAALERNITIGSHTFKQTLEPQVYYTYIPYRRQFEIPLFDTSSNTPTYDQLFNYNRFSGIDRIGDTNQIGVGVSTRLIDRFSGLEKVRLGIGDIIYFVNRNVTLCNSDAICNDYPGAHANQQRLSPITGTIDYHIIPSWNASGNAAWDPVSKQITTSNIAFHYQPDTERIVNFGINYVNQGELASFKVVTDTNLTNQTILIPNQSMTVLDTSVAWPITSHVSTIGRISHDWSSGYLQNVLYGIQYDTCCVTVRIVGNHTFLGLNPNRNYKPQYNNEFYIQLSLKGLGNVGNGNPQGLLNKISGYTNSQFG